MEIFQRAGMEMDSRLRFEQIYITKGEELPPVHESVQLSYYASPIYDFAELPRHLQKTLPINCILPTKHRQTGCPFYPHAASGLFSTLC